MQQYTRLKDDAAEYDIGLALVVDAEIFRLDALIRWLDSVDGRLKRLAVGDPLPDPIAVPRLRQRIGVRR